MNRFLRLAVDFCLDYLSLTAWVSWDMTQVERGSERIIVCFRGIPWRLGKRI